MQEHPDIKIPMNDSCRTIHSFIINHVKNGGKYKQLILDKALMLHAGEALLACALTGDSEALLIDDKPDTIHK